MELASLVRADRYRLVFSREKALMLFSDSREKARSLYCRRARWMNLFLK